jgi:hypothetical protein
MLLVAENVRSQCQKPVSALSKYSFEPIQCLVLSLGSDMRRLAFIAGLDGAVAWPLTTRAPQPAMPVIGSLNIQAPEAYARRLAKFHRRLRHEIRARRIRIH